MAVIVFPPIIDWSFMKQRPQQLMQQLARSGHTVYYCNKTQKEKMEKMEALKGSLDDPRLGGLQAEHYAACIEQQLEERLFIVHQHKVWLSRRWPSIRRQASSGTIVWCTLPQLTKLALHYEADYLVYDCVDDFPELAPYEPAMVAAADWIICTSERIRERLRRQYPGRAVALVRNGYDSGMGLHLPDPAEETPLLPDIGAGRWVGYVGAWAPWVDAALLKRLAGRLPQGDRLAIIGPEFGRREAQGLLHIGQLAHHALPAYIRKLSVCLIPFLPMPVALAANPIKAYEYLASGKPVVATALPECLAMAPHVDCCRSSEQFIHTVLQRLREPGDGSARVRYALEHTWAARVQELMQAIPVLSAG